MSESKKFSGCAATSDSTGLQLIAVDGSGNVKLLTYAGLVAMLAGTGSVMTSVTLQPQDLDADALADTMTVYTPYGDMNSSYWVGMNFDNFPFVKPSGGFSLICLPEGRYKRQLVTCYSGTMLYMRSTYYNGATGKTIWGAWKGIDSTEA